EPPERTWGHVPELEPGQPSIRQRQPRRHGEDLGWNHGPGAIRFSPQFRLSLRGELEPRWPASGGRRGWPDDHALGSPDRARDGDLARAYQRRDRAGLEPG